MSSYPWPANWASQRLLRDAEKSISCTLQTPPLSSIPQRNVQRDKGLTPAAGQVQRPSAEGATRLDELGHRHVQDALATRLGAGDTRRETLDE